MKKGDRVECNVYREYKGPNALTRAVIEQAKKGKNIIEFGNIIEALTALKL